MSEKEIDEIIYQARIIYNDSTDKAREEYYKKTMPDYKIWCEKKDKPEQIWIKKNNEAQRICDEALNKIPDSKLKEKCQLKRFVRRDNNEKP